MSFKYEDDYVLKDFSLKVPKGTSVALVGQSGSGKSTLANLVTRFYDVNEGSISIDGNDVKNISKKSRKKDIDPKITNRIWRNMILSYIDFEKRNFKKK